MPAGLQPFDLRELSRRIDEAREARGLTMAALSREVGVSASTIRRFATADDAEADGVLALVGWLGDPPERFIADSPVRGTPLPPAGTGQIRVDMSRVSQPAKGRRTRTRTTIQRLAAAAGARSDRHVFFGGPIPESRSGKVSGSREEEPRVVPTDPGGSR